MKMLKRKLVYVGHEYHKKTNSVNFLLEILKSKYEVYCVSYREDTRKFYGDKRIREEHFDVLLLFQMPVSVKLLKKVFCFDHGVYIPMYDGTGEAPVDFWLDYREFNIINFSRALHERLLKIGLSSHYVQYFPKVAPEFVAGKADKAFFWQRRDTINIHTVCDLLAQSCVKEIHIHQAADPGQNFISPKKIEENIYHITYSSWYEKKEDMLRDVEKAAVYIAPREYEGIGMSFLEAMAMGKCVIAPDHPTMNEYIIHGVNGYLYDMDHVRAIGNPDLKKIQKNAYIFMKKGFHTWERRKYKILDWLEQDAKINDRLLKKAYRKKSVVGKKYLAGKLYYKLFGKTGLDKNVINLIKKLKKE